METLLWVIIVGGIITVGLAVQASRKPAAWRTSDRGNPTTLCHGKRITVFPSDSGQLWKFCIADPSDRTDPIYSEWYSDQETARSEAISLVTTGRVTAKTYREQKEENLREDAPAILDRATKKREEMEKAIARLDKLKNPTPEQFDRVAKRLSDAVRITKHSHHTLISCDADAEIIRQAGEIPLAIIDLKDRLAEVRSRRLPD